MARVLMLAARALALAVAALLPAVVTAACSSDEEWPLPRPLVGPGLDAAVSCSELRDAAGSELSPDAAGPPCAVDGIECALGLDAGCTVGKRYVAECFAQRWRLGCVEDPSDPDAAP